MGKKKYTTEYASAELKRMRELYDVPYYILYGERDDGKSYAVKRDAIIDEISKGNSFVYLRRLHSHIVRKNCLKVFEDIQDEAIKKLGSPICYDSQKGFYIGEGETERVVGIARSIDEVMLYKSIPITNVTVIFFDEFIDYTYMPDEIPKFLHSISNICRGSNYGKVKIYMCGNTINKYSPYFKLFGIDPNKAKQGEIYYVKHKLGVSAAFEHTPTKVEDIITKVKYNDYIGFDDNESVNMIMFGEWEYQTCQTKQIDGITWNCMRHFVPIYFTAHTKVYEFTINTDLKVPIVFIRTINVQMGKVKDTVKYNLALDDTVRLVSKKGYVPTIKKVNSLVDANTRDKWALVQECLECGRVIFDTVETGSDIISLLMKK